VHDSCREESVVLAGDPKAEQDARICHCRSATAGAARVFWIDVKRLVPSPTQIGAGLESMNRLLKQTGI
jgi:hypothetical protein